MAAVLRRGAATYKDFMHIKAHIQRTINEQRHNFSMYAAIGFGLLLLILLALGDYALNVCGRF